MKIVRKEAKRLRREFLKRAAHRRAPWATLFPWRDREYLKSLSPLAPWFVATSIGAGAQIQSLLLVLGVGCAVLWFGFVFWNLLLVEGRLRDKEYILVGRHLLSKEYRR